MRHFDHSGRLTALFEKPTAFGALAKSSVTARPSLFRPWSAARWQFPGYLIERAFDEAHAGDFKSGSRENAPQ